MLAITMLPDKFTIDEVKANFRFYEPITSQDSALRLCIYGIASCLTRVPDKALQYFKKTLFIDLDNTIGDTGGGLHSTTAAGSWAVLVMGFAGMKLIQGVLHFDPYLPDDCEGYTFNIRHRGCLVKVTVTDRLVTYALTKTPAGVEDLVLIHAGSNRIHLRKGASSTVRLIREIRVFGFDAVIFDLDSIVSNIERYHYEA
uniref:Putative glycosyl hydrolase yvdK n=1 Tax=Lygus hesperus TaxID=30085 RepID=A0A0A9W0W7_LYGHE